MNTQQKGNDETAVNNLKQDIPIQIRQCAVNYLNAVFAIFFYPLLASSFKISKKSKESD